MLSLKLSIRNIKNELYKNNWWCIILTQKENEDIKNVKGSFRNRPCLCGSGVKHKKCHSNIKPNSRAGYLLELYGEIGNIIKEYQEKKGEYPPCTKGCSACCYQFKPISDIEFKIIANEINSWPNEKIQALKTKVFLQFQTIEEEFPSLYQALIEKEIYHPDMYKKMFDSLNQAFTGLPCPLLQLDTNECGAYHSRPYVCRVQGTTSYSDDEYEVCDKIPSNDHNRYFTPDISEQVYKHRLIVNIIDPISGRIYHQQFYPLLYWLYLSFKETEEMNEKEKTTPLLKALWIKSESLHFDIEAEIANEVYVNEFKNISKK